MTLGSKSYSFVLPQKKSCDQALPTVYEEKRSGDRDVFKVIKKKKHSKKEQRQETVLALFLHNYHMISLWGLITIFLIPLVKVGSLTEN